MVRTCYTVKGCGWMHLLFLVFALRPEAWLRFVDFVLMFSHRRSAAFANINLLNLGARVGAIRNVQGYCQV